MQLSIEPEMIEIPAGRFLMGAGVDQVETLTDEFELAGKWKEKSFFAREQPQHEITLPAFHIGRFPVTVGEYRQFIDDGGYRKRDFWSEVGWDWLESCKRRQPDYWGDKQWSGRDQLPIVGVSWYEAVTYGVWLSSVTGLK